MDNTLIPYDTIAAAKDRNPDAIEAILSHFADLIKIVSFRVYNGIDVKNSYYDEDLQQYVRGRLY